jgi:23S rRNA pseudouridine2605 synthase
MKTLGKVPLERALSKLGLASRTQTKTWISEGRLKVNGKVAKDPAMPVTPEKDSFVLDGIVLKKDTWRTILLYKPKGYVTTKSDEKGRKTVYDLLPKELHVLHPVGRLDMHTTGLLLLTNDTKLSNLLTDPKNEFERTYAVSVKGQITEEVVKRLQKGIEDKDEILQAAKIVVRKSSGRESHLLVTLTEGKNREIRRMFDAVNHEVITLKRISFGPLTLGELEPGKFRDVTRKELENI